jgi:hypothetical protein
MDGWFAQTPLLGIAGGLIAIGIVIYTLVLITRNIDEEPGADEKSREITSDPNMWLTPPY